MERCKYCGARLKRDAAGQYCPTRNCQWQHGVSTPDGEVMDPGTRDRLVLCGQAAVDALSLDSDHDSPDEVTVSIERLQGGPGPKIIGLHGPAECPAGACDGCEGFHHWIPECRDEDAEHPAIEAEYVTWYRCKHCPAWCEDIEEK